MDMCMHTGAAGNDGVEDSVSVEQVKRNAWNKIWKHPTCYVTVSYCDVQLYLNRTTKGILFYFYLSPVFLSHGCVTVVLTEI